MGGLQKTRRRNNMKIAKAVPLAVSALFTVLLVCSSIADADPSGGGVAAVSVAETVHAAAQVASLSEELDQVLAEYRSEISADRRKALLKQAKNILARLIEQANNVESEISILSEKKLDTVYAQKLERVLSRVLQMKAAAESKLQGTGQAG
jgi:hypothetical protein